MSDMTHAPGPAHAKPGKRTRPWPLLPIAASAAVAIWSGWVGLGQMCGFGPVNLLPGIGGGFHVNTAIALPIGVEAYGAYGLKVWLNPATPERARGFARKSAIGALILGAFGQVIYHLLAHVGAVRAPWPVVVLVSCMPIATVAFAATLWHLTHLGGGEDTAAGSVTEDVPVVTADAPHMVTMPSDRVVTTEPPRVVPSVAPSVVTTDEPPEADLETTAEPAVVVAEPVPVVPAKRRRVVAADATDDQLAGLILEHAEDVAALTPYRVNKIIKDQGGKKKLGDPRALRVIVLVQRMHRARTVVAIGDRR